MFSTEFYSKLDPNYRYNLGKIENLFIRPSKTDILQLHPFIENKDDENTVTDFIGGYMVPSEFWDIVPNDVLHDVCPRFYDQLFFGSFFYKDLERTHQKYYDNDNSLGFTTLEGLKFPNKYLEQRMEYYEKESDSFIPHDVRQRYEAMKALYSKIKATEGDTDKWFAALMEADDHQFVCQNVEYKLGTDLTDKYLWKKYINYLWEHDFKLLLETYSKCVRFFIDDIEIMGGYRQAAIEYGRHVPVPWINPCSIEVFDDHFWDEKVQQQQDQTEKVQQQPLTIHFDGRNARNQLFPFLSPTIRYILENANGNVLQKLFKACKWFRTAQPVNVCYKFEENYRGLNQSVVIKESIKSVNNSILRSNIDQLFISNYFLYSSVNRTALSNLIPKIYRFTAKYVNIHRQYLSLAELQFFIGHGNVIKLELTNVVDSDGEAFSLESILRLTPKIKSVSLSSVKCSTETSQKLSELKLQSKLNNMDISLTNSILLCPREFAKFVKMNCSSTAQIRLCLDPKTVNEEYLVRFRQVLGGAINNEWISHEKEIVFRISSFML